MTLRGFNLSNMTLDQLNDAYEKGKITPEEEFLAWLEAQVKIARDNYMKCKLSDSDKYRSRMITFEIVLKRFTEINNP